MQCNIILCFDMECKICWIIIKCVVRFDLNAISECNRIVITSVEESLDVALTIFLSAFLKSRSQTQVSTWGFKHVIHDVKRLLNIFQPFPFSFRAPLIFPLRASVLKLNLREEFPSL